MGLPSTKSFSCMMASPENRLKQYWISLLRALKRIRSLNNAHSVRPGTPVGIRRAFPDHTVRTARSKAGVLCLTANSCALPRKPDLKYYSPPTQICDISRICKGGNWQLWFSAETDGAW